jgi:hypothetical protein
MTEKNYAFVVDNKVTNIVVFDDPSQELLDTFIQQNNLDYLIEADSKAAIGGVYDGTQFIPVSPYPSWIWDNTVKQWVAPVSKPSEGVWEWSEETLNWLDVEKDYEWSDELSLWVLKTE